MTALFRLASIALDEKTISQRRVEVQHELTVAIQDLLAENNFVPKEAGQGPYQMRISLEESRFIFDLTDALGVATKTVFSIQPLKKIIRDYFMICETYYDKISSHGTHYRIEAIDMGRRGLHNEGAEVLKEMLEGKIEVDFATARRLFTLICVLCMK